jgi:predicted enzyme related to lactoylglutathione lyase
MPNPVVHFEYHSNNPKELQDFYSTLFGWHVDTNNPMDYGFVDTHAGGINGGITSPPDGTGRVVVSVEVDDLGAYLKKAEELGAKTVVPITEIPRCDLRRHPGPSGKLARPGQVGRR